MTGGPIIIRTLTQSIVRFENILPEVRVQLVDRHLTLDDLADEERQQVALGDLREDDVILPTQVVAVVGQAPETIVLIRALLLTLTSMVHMEAILFVSGSSQSCRVFECITGSQRDLFPVDHDIGVVSTRG